MRGSECRRVRHSSITRADRTDKTSSNVDVRRSHPIITSGRFMKLHGEMSINGKKYRAGEEMPWKFIYPFFLFHMLMFGGSGFFMAYADDGPPLGFLYLHGGIAIFVYSVFYLNIFGREEVKWMLINAGLGIFGIYAEVDWLLSLSGKAVSDYPFHVHLVPFLYYIMYTFLLRQAVLDLTGARADAAKRKIVERSYIGLSLVIYAGLHLLRP